MSIETELKLRIAPENIQQFMQHPLLAEAVHVSPPQSLYNTYFDTHDRMLFQQGIGLRVRKIGDQYVQSIKTSGSGLGGLHQRQEWEMEIADNTPNFSIFPAHLFPHGESYEYYEQKIQALFITDFVRETWDLFLEEGSQIEVVLDQGEIRTQTKKVPLCEIELELKSGLPDRLFQVALILQKNVPLIIENKSKAARGYALCHPQPVIAHKAKHFVGLLPEMTAEQAFIKIVIYCLEHLQANEEVVHHGEDIEGIHQMRVALRRLRSVFNLYKILIPNKAHTKLRKEIKGITAILGGARDWDVFSVAIQNLPFDPKEDYEFIVSQVTVQRTQAYQIVREMLGDPRYSRMLLMLGKWIHRRSWRLHLDSWGGLDMPVKNLTDQILNKHYHLVCQQGKCLQQLNAEERHELRISVKKMTYGVRFFAELYPEGLVRPFAQALSQVQEELGILNDARVALELLKQLELQDHPVQYFLKGWYAHQQKVHLSHLEQAWQHWRQQEVFWK